MEGLSLKAPLIQAPMAGVQGVELAAAVANAGALGSLPCAMLSLDALQDSLQQLKTLTRRPVNLNFFCHQEQSESTARYQAWLESLAPYFNEFGLSPRDLPEGPQRAPFSPAVAEVVESFAPAVVSFHFGLPEPELLARVKRWGTLILSSATTLEEARWLQDYGADVVIAQGLEAGGHRGQFLREDFVGQLPTTDLVTACVAELSVPVVAAGGLGSVEAVTAMRDLGAAGVQLGSAFLLADEATTSALHRAALVSDRVSQTTLTNLYTGRPARGIVTRLMRELGPLSTRAPVFPLAANAVGALRAAAEKNGDDSFTPRWCGERDRPRAAREADSVADYAEARHQV